MKAIEYLEEQKFGYYHFTELTSTGISPNNDNIAKFAEDYHQAKLNLLTIPVVSSNATENRPNGLENDVWWCPNCKEVVEPHDVTNDERHGVENCMCKVN